MCAFNASVPSADTLERIVVADKTALAPTSGWKQVAFAPDGSIISSIFTKSYTWSKPRPFEASEWEEVDISGLEKHWHGEAEVKGLGPVTSNYWKNAATGALRKEYSTAGAPTCRDRHALSLATSVPALTPHSRYRLRDLAI